MKKEAELNWTDFISKVHFKVGNSIRSASTGRIKRLEFSLQQLLFRPNYVASENGYRSYFFLLPPLSGFEIYRRTVPFVWRNLAGFFFSERLIFSDYLKRLYEKEQATNCLQ